MANKNRVFSISGEYTDAYYDNGRLMFRVLSNGYRFVFDITDLGLEKIDGVHTTDGYHIEYGDYINVFGNIGVDSTGVVLNAESIMKLY